MSYKFLTLLLLIGLLTSAVKAQNKNDEEVKKEAEDMQRFLNEYSKSLKNKKQRSTFNQPGGGTDSTLVNYDFRSSQLDSLRLEIRELSQKVDKLIPMIKEVYNTRPSYERRSKIADKAIGECKCVRVYFPFNSDEFDKADLKSLDSISSILKNNSKLKVKIEGHADRIGGKEPNEKISEKRAQAVYNYLLGTKIIGPANLSVEWHGNTRPQINTNDESLFWLNRRAEIYLE